MPGGWDAGHALAFRFGGMALAVEIRSKNRNSSAERGGDPTPKKAIDICGIPVILESPQDAVRVWLLDPRWVLDAKPTEGWQPGALEHLPLLPRPRRHR